MLKGIIRNWVEWAVVIAVVLLSLAFVASCAVTPQGPAGWQYVGVLLRPDGSQLEYWRNPDDGKLYRRDTDGFHAEAE